MILYILARFAGCLLGYALGVALAKALGSWTALVVIACLYILFRDSDDSPKS